MFKSLLCGILLLSLWNIILEASSISSEECSRTYLGRTGHGVITSYNYPFDYLHNLTCTYSIYVTSDPDTTNVVCFTFHRFSLEGSTPFCSFDYLKLEYPELKYCADGLWMYGVQTTSPGSNVWSKDFCWTVKNTKSFNITFSSDNNINSGGFYAEYFVYHGVDNERILPPGNLGQAPCSADEWTCFNRRCIDESMLCDGIDQCGDDSDESYVHARCGEQNVLACDFTSVSVSDGYCGFTHEGWYRTREQHSPYGPQGDHTNGTSGFYVYSDVNQSSAFLLSPELSLPRNKTYCLSFWYYIYGRPAAAILRVYVTRDQAYSRPEWSRSQAPENQWIKGEITIHSLANIQVIFAAELDNSFSGVALDDVSVLPGACLGDDLSCNFESGVCGWNITKSITHLNGKLEGDIKWNLHSRLLGPTGPAWDHSSKDGGGQYLYLNNTSPPSHNNLALLVSSPLSSYPGPYKCLHFWYHMSGQDRDCCQLKVKVHAADGSLSEAVWEKMGDVRSAWKEAYVNLNVRDPFQLVLEGMISADSKSQIALDEIMYSEGLCSGTGSGACEMGQYLCGDGQCINATWRCDGKQDCVDMSDEDWRAGCTTTLPSTTTTPLVTFPQPTCSPGHFQCHSDGRCIPGDWVCDKFDDCDDRSDETSLAGCPGSPGGVLEPCRGDKFLCRNGRCIVGDRRCDRHDNCGDNSDEINCTATTVAVPGVCVGSEFMCLEDQMCIQESRVCDDVQDCSDNSDESTEHAKCDQKAVVSYTSVTLGAGAISGIAIGCLLCIGLIILSALLGRKRRKPQPRRHRQRGSDIATISEASTIERHLNMLEAIRSPMRSLTGLPPYSAENLENMGYTSDGTVTLGRGAPAGVLFPPEEPPPPYDSVIKETDEGGGPRTGSTVNTPSSTRGPSGAQTPEDDSYGFRSRSRPGSARASRRRSRERTPVRSQANFSERSVDQPVYPSHSDAPTPSHSTGTLGSRSDEGENIYEELSVPTLTRPRQLRTEPSSSSTLYQPATVSSPLPSPSSYNPGTASNTEAVVASVHPPPLRTIPHQRIRLGTQALHNRPVAATYRPRNYYNDQNPGVNVPGRQGVGYEPLEPPGPYNLQNNPYTIPSPNSEVMPSTIGTEAPRRDPSINSLGRHSQRNQRHHEPEPSTHRLYGSHRNPPRNYGSNNAGRVPYQPQTQAVQPQTHAVQPQTQAVQPQTQAVQPQLYQPRVRMQNARPGSLSPRVMPNPALSPRALPPSSALSPRAMPSPKVYSDHGAQHPGASVQPENYLYHPQDGEQRPAPGAGHNRDLNNASFASTGSQEQLIGSPPGVRAQYSQHPRAGSNISSDLDSTSPLVASRDDRGTELEILTPTAV